MCGSPLLGQVVGVTHSPCTPGVWFSFSLVGRFSGRLSSFSTSTPCRCSSEIYSWLAPWPILFYAFSFDPLASLLLSGSSAGWAHAVAIDSSSNGCTGSWDTRKWFTQMWNSLPLSILAVQHLYANWSLLEIRNSYFPVTTTLSRRSRLCSFSHVSLIFALCWKILAWEEPRAPIPPRFLTIEE